MHHPTRLYNPWLSQAWGIWFASLAVLALGFVLKPFTDSGAFLAFFLSGLYAFIALMVHYYAWHAGKRLSAFARGEYLAHWTYSMEEWQQYLQSNSLEKQVNYRLIPGIACIISLAYGLVLCSLLAHHYWHDLPENDPRFFLFILVTMGGTTFCAGMGWYLGTMLRACIRVNARCSDDRSAYIGRGGLYVNGHVESWSAFGLFLRDVTVTEGKLRFVLEDIENNSRTFILPIPTGREQEAEEVIVQLKGTGGKVP